MKVPQKTNVSDALELLSDEVWQEIQRIRTEGAEAMSKGRYDTAKAVIDFASKLEAFAGAVDSLTEQWETISVQHDAEPEVVKAIVGKSFFNKARKGTITPPKAYFVPLLESLVELGGEAKLKDAIDLVGQKMEGKLLPKDFESLNSNSGLLRWRNKVMWARSSLVNQLGYMRNDTGHGVWGISVKGRQWLQSLKS